MAGQDFRKGAIPEGVSKTSQSSRASIAAPRWNVTVKWSRKTYLTKDNCERCLPSRDEADIRLPGQMFICVVRRMQS